MNEQENGLVLIGYKANRVNAKETHKVEDLVKADGGYLDHEALCGAGFDGESKSYVTENLPATATEEDVLSFLCPKCVREYRIQMKAAEAVSSVILGVDPEKAVQKALDETAKALNRLSTPVLIVNPPPPGSMLDKVLRISERTGGPPGIEDTPAVDEKYADAYNGEVMNTLSSDTKQVLLDRAAILDQASEVLLATAKEARSIGLDLGTFTPRAVWREGKKLRKLSNRLKDKANSIT